jgi:Flp pilus assembly protein TadD
VLLGAAGAFWAIVGGTLALTVMRGVPIRAPQHLLLQAMSTPLCLFSLTVSYSLISIINHDAYAISHAGGFVSGFVTVLVAPFGARQARTFEAMGAVTVGLVVLSGLLYPQPRSREAAALTEAKTLIKMDDFAAATRVLESASAAYPASAAIHHLLGVGYLVKGNASGSLRHLEEACRLRPSNAEFRTDLGKLYFEAGRYDAAIANLTEAVRLAPKHFRSNYLLALALAKKRDFFAAKEAIDHAVELNPSSAEAYVVLACLDVEFGKYRDASTALRKAVQLNPAVNFPQELRYFIPLN